MLVDILREGMNLELAQRSPVRNVLTLGQILVAEEQHLVIEPRLLKFGDDLIVEVAQVNIADLSADGTGHWLDLDPVEIPYGSSINSHRSPPGCYATVTKYRLLEKWQPRSAAALQTERSACKFP